MKRVFLDTNIILDVLEMREPFFVPAATLLNMGSKGEVELCVSALTLINTVYIARKHLGYSYCIKFLKNFRQLVSITPMGETEIDTALKSDSKDIEDAFQCQSAIAAGCECIVTRDSGHFVGCSIPVLSAEELVRSLSK